MRGTLCTASASFPAGARLKVMHVSPRLTTAALIAGTLAGGLLAGAPAHADTVVVADPTAQNVTAYASTAAWSRRTADGSHRLVVSDGAGSVADAAIDPSSVPFDPDLGPTASNGRFVVYSRCATGSATRACDVYGYDLAARSERRISAASSSTRSEVGPSYFKGVVAFGRRGARGGLYVAYRGRGARRIWSGVTDQTDLSATRVIASNATVLRISQPSGDHPRTLRRGMRGEESETVVSSPVLARYRAFWLVTSREFTARGSIVETVSVRSASRSVRRVDRPFAGEVNGFALGRASVPQLTSGPAGIARIDPPLVIPV